MSRARSILALAVASLLLLQGWVRAETPRVALVVLPGAGADRALVRRVRRAVLKSFRSGQGIKLVDPLKAAVGQRGKRAEYLTFLEEGRRELTAKQYREASRSLGLAVAAIRKDLSRTPKAALSEATLELAYAQCGAGRRQVALRTLIELLVWRPDHPLALPGDSPAGWDHLAQQARVSVGSLKTGSVQISSEPAGAEAFVDGRRLGPTPVSAEGLREGTHFLTLLLEGYERMVVPLEVRRGEQTSSFSLTESPRSQALAAAFAAATPYLGDELEVESLKALAAPHALFVVVAKKGESVELRAFYYELATGRPVAYTVLHTPLPIRRDRVGALALWRLRPVQLRRELPLEPQRRPWYRRWWVWTIAGAVAAASVGIPLALTARSSGGAERYQLRW